ncbi:MAG TPA: hypothetical protein ENO18_05050 [Caldithrix sp.]|nr:hypothetical protein [Caldithrix sp.]
MNYYNYLFYWVYSRQKKYGGQFVGIFVSSMILTLVVWACIIDVYLTLLVTKIAKTVIEPMPTALFVIIALFAFHIIYFSLNNRHVRIEKKYDELSNLGHRKARITTISIISLIIIYNIVIGSFR